MMYFSAQFSAIKMYYHTQARAVVCTCMNAHQHTHTHTQLTAPNLTESYHRTLTARDNRLMSRHSEAECGERQSVCVCVGERDADQEKKRLRLPAGKPVLISAGFQTHLLALFNIPVVKRDGLLLPMASERRETM